MGIKSNFQELFAILQHLFDSPSFSVLKYSLSQRKYFHFFITTKDLQMSLEITIQALVDAVKANTAAMVALSGSGTVANKTAPTTDKKATTDDGAGAGEAAATNKAPTAAEKKAAAAAKKAAEDKAKKSDEITDERITEVFGPLLAKTHENLASNKEFVATINTHFGVTKLRELDQEGRKQAVEWGLARAEDEDFEIPGAEEEDDGV